MARGFGERLAGAGQALQAFDAAYMQAKERQERQRQLRDAELLYNTRNAAGARMQQKVPAYTLAGSTAGTPVAGLNVPQTQAPAQRQPAPTTAAAPPVTTAAPATRLVGTMEPRQEIRPMELQYRQGLTTQRPPYVNYTETQEQQLAGMRQRRATINQELRYIDEQLRQIPTGRALGTGDQVLRQTYEAQKARLMREREALVNQLRGVTEDTSTRRFIPGAPGLSVPVPSTSALAVPFQTQPGQMTTPELVLREEPAAAPAGVRPDMMRLDGTTKSARGFLGPITNNISGKTMTELSVGQPGSPEGYYPLLVPTLTQDEIRTLQNLNIGTDPIPPSILRKAKAHAEQRTAQGLSPFYQDGEAAPATAAPPKQQKAQEELTEAVEKTPMGEGPAPGKLADTVAAAAGGIMYGADPEDFDPQAIDASIQQALQLRQNLAIQYEELVKRGFAYRAMEIVPQIQAIDLGLYKAQGEMGVYEGVGSGNWSRAVTVLSQFKGIPHQVLDRQDGTYDLYINGRVSEVAQSPAQLADYFRYQLNDGYRAQKAKIAGEQVAQQNEIDKIVTKAVLDAQGDMQVALVNAQKELIKQGMVNDAQKLTLDTSNGIAWVQEDGQVSVVDPEGLIRKVAGQEVAFPTTTQVPGFGR